jgi:hypothetical protein
MATPRVFPSCQTQNHAILLDGQTCNACGSEPWRPDPVTLEPPPRPSVRLPQRPSVYTPSHNPPALGLASQLIGSSERLRGFPHQRGQIAPRIQPPVSTPPAETVVQFTVALAVGQWHNRDCVFSIRSNLFTTTLPAQQDFTFIGFVTKLVIAAQSAGMEIPGHYAGTWLVATNHKKPLIFLPRWTKSRQLEAMIREVGWPNGKDCGMKGIPASAYPTTVCWKPHRVREEDEFDDPDDLDNHLHSPPPPDNPPPVSHRRTISEVTARREREQEDDEERPAQRQAIEQEDREQEDGEQEGGEQEGGEQELQARPTRASGRRRAAPRRLEDEI